MSFHTKYNFFYFFLYLTYSDKGNMCAKKVDLRVFGMSCEDCKFTIEKNLKENPAVIRVDIRYPEGTGEVVIDDSKIQPSEIPKMPIFSGKSHYRAQVRDTNEV